MRITILITSIVVAMLMTVSPAAAQEGSVGDPFTTEIVACPDAIVNGAAFNVSPEAAAAYGLGEEIEGETYACGVVYAPKGTTQMKRALFVGMPLNFTLVPDEELPQRSAS